MNKWKKGDKKEPSPLSLSADFLVGQVAGRVGFPEVSGYGFGAGTEIAIANVEVLALGAASFEQRLTVFHSR